jgi:hypothetical protein
MFELNFGKPSFGTGLTDTLNGVDLIGTNISDFSGPNLGNYNSLAGYGASAVLPNNGSLSAPVKPVDSAGLGFFDKVGAGVSAFKSLSDAYLGMKQYGLAKDALKESQQQFDLNFGAQRNTINSQLADRQRARVASNPNAYQSEAEYMAKWGIK